VADDPLPARDEIPPPAAAGPFRGLFRDFPPATRAELWSGVVLIALSLFCAAWLIKWRFDALALERDSVTVEGKVLRLWTTRANNGPAYRVEYEYSAPLEAEPRVFREQVQLYEEYFNALREGGPIAVTVCRTDPTNHRVLGEAPRASSSIAALVFGLTFVAFLALVGGFNLWWWICRRKPEPSPTDA
jgi:hypothetical protein